MKIKICGITKADDALLCRKLGADLIGLILYPKSPRFVPEDRRKEILEAAGDLKKVAVMVNPSEEEAIRVLNSGFDLIQLHGEESPELAESIGMERVIKAFRVKDKAPHIDTRWRNSYAILLDTYSDKAYGGTGKSFDWSIAREIISSGFRVFISGGLRADNVALAIKYTNPFGVDVSSGVELKPGIKDPSKVRKFIQEARPS
jgi:phosphoribosylanthranilate isomerase